MINVNAHRPGYKHTPLGWIPEEWEICRLEKLAMLISGQHLDPDGYNKCKIGTPYFTGPTDYTNDENEVTKWTERSNALAQSGDILITVKGSGVGSLHNLTLEQVAIGRQVMGISSKNISNAAFIYQQLILRSYYFQELAKGNMIPGLTRGDILTLELIAPPQFEQYRIADILAEWDAAIYCTQQIVSKLQKRNKGLLHQLLTGNKRLKGFIKKWSEIHLSDAFVERNEVNADNLPLLSITADRGVIYQSDSDKKDTSNEDKSKYRRICINDIGYNTMRMWQGRSALSTLEGIVSPAYTIVTPRPGYQSDFFSYLFKLPSVVNKFFRNSQGLVDDTLNCKFRDFALVKVKVPSFEEQVSISKVIAKAIEEVKLQEQQLKLLQQQKKALLQKLLTGEIRVKVNQEQEVI